MRGVAAVSDMRGPIHELAKRLCGAVQGTYKHHVQIVYKWLLQREDAVLYDHKSVIVQFHQGVAVSRAISGFLHFMANYRTPEQRLNMLVAELEQLLGRWKP